MITLLHDMREAVKGEILHDLRNGTILRYDCRQTIWLFSMIKFISTFLKLTQKQNTI